MAQTLVPSTIKFNLSGTSINILDAQLALSFKNNSSYQECMSRAGIKSYVLAKGTSITQEGDMTITIMKTPDGKQDGSIKTLQDNLQHVQKSNHPSDYTKDITVVLENPSSEKFLDVSFKGYVSELTTQGPDSTNFLTYLGTVTVYDPSTIKVSN